MTRKLLLLDIVLVGAVAAAGFQFHKLWLAAQAREAATLRRTVKPAKLPPLPPLPQEPPVAASTYVDVAAKMLFDPSRNPTVVIEKPPEPPPKPMPPLPFYHGMLNLGEGTIAIFSATATSPHQAIHPGEKIGDFTLVDASGQEVTLEWDGKQIHKTVDELSDHKRNDAAQQGQAAAVRTASTADSRTELAEPQAQPQPQQAAPAKAGPGEMTAFGYRTCNTNDGVAPGTVTDGFRKTMHSTPFGSTCSWEPVR